MAYRKRVTDGHRIAVDTSAADLIPGGSVLQHATCSCGWTTGPQWKPHTMITVAVAMHGGAP